MTSVSQDPRIAAAMPGPTIQAAARVSSSFARPYVYAPVIAVGKITGSGVARATIGAVPRRTWIPGVITIPPPTPNSPESMPETKPIRTPTTAWAKVIAGARPRVAACRARPGRPHA